MARHEIELPFRDLDGQRPAHLRTLNLNQRGGAGLAHGANQRNRHFIRGVETFNKNGLVAFKTNGILDEKSREFVEASIVHRKITIPSLPSNATLRRFLRGFPADQPGRESPIDLISEWPAVSLFGQPQARALNQ